MRYLIDMTQLRSRCKPNVEILGSNQDESVLGLIHNLYATTNILKMDIEHRPGFECAQEQDQIRC